MSALRLFTRSPGFAAMVVFVLALGIGASTTVFNVVNSVLLKPLPVEKPEELVYFDKPSFSYPIFGEVRDRAGIFDGFFGWNIDRMNVAWDDDYELAHVLQVTGDFYRTLGVRAAAGRLLGQEDDARQAAVAVISYDCWQRRFRRDPAAIGRSIRIERLPVTIVGVAPRGFFGVASGLAPEVTIPATLVPVLNPTGEGLNNWSGAWLHLMGRLKPGVGIGQANSALKVFWPQVLEAVTDPLSPRRKQFLARPTALVSAREGFSRVRNRFERPLLVLLGLVTLLTLAACLTAANLLLARATARSREMAVRLALGAGRLRLARQLFGEGMLLASAGAAAGLLCGAWGGTLLVSLLSTTEEPIRLNLDPDWRVLAFTAVTAILTAVLFSLAPAIRAARVAPGAALHESSRWTTGRRGRLTSALVAGQVALSMLLMAGAALFARSLYRLVTLDPGFRRENLLLASADALVAGYKDAPLAAFHSRTLDRLRSLPGVAAVGLCWVPPVSNEMGYWTGNVAVDGEGVPPDGPKTYFNAVSPGYFPTVGTALLRGRDFDSRDREGAARAVIVNESLATAYFPGRDPIGRTLSIGLHAARQNLIILGVIQDARYQSLHEPPLRIAYFPLAQTPERRGANLIAAIRVQGSPAALADAVRGAIRSIDANVPLRIETMSDRIRESLVTERVVAVISAFLGLAALVLAAAGLYGLLAYTVSRRSPEIGVRIALGAPRTAVEWMVFRESLALAAAGIALGVAATLALGRFVAGLLHGIGAADGASLAAAGAVVLAVSMTAGYVPARRASRVDPAVVLRQE
jgi:putative ABC transport system permease protein